MRRPYTDVLHIISSISMYRWPNSVETDFVFGENRPEDRLKCLYQNQLDTCTSQGGCMWFIGGVGWKTIMHSTRCVT
jgi:hypothetical protein